MSTHKYMDKICIASIILALIVTTIFMNGKSVGIQAMQKTLGYENRLFDTSRVHTVDIVMKDWDKFITTCKDKKYSSCSVVIDGEKYANVGIRAKGSSSLDDVVSAGSSRYSLKIEFDHYEKAINYHGLDKLSLNNIIQDNTYMMDYLSYQMMADFGLNSPMCSYTNIKVNGKPWGFYLAVEGMEESFLKRNFGSNYGNFYKSEGSDKEAGNMADEWDQDDGIEEYAVDLQYLGNKSERYSLFFDHAKTKISFKDKKRFISAIKDLNRRRKLENAIDVNEVIRYFIVHGFVVNGDSYTGDEAHNYYLYEKGGKLSMIPWDYNLSFGIFLDGEATSAVNTPIDDALINRPMQSWIFKNQKYIKMYHNYYRKFLATADISKRIKATETLIAPYVEKDPSKFCSYEDFKKAVYTLNRFCHLRVKSIGGQLNGTIPSTSKGQAEDKKALVDASDINIFDMMNKPIN